MKTIGATPLLKQLLQRKLLSDRLSWLGLNDENTFQWIVDLTRANWKTTDSVSPAILEKLVQFELVSLDELSALKAPRNLQYKEIPFPFVEAVNFELTYDCNMQCSHCLQHNLRARRQTMWISTEVVRRALQDAWFAGLALKGINFTGGEVFLPDSKLLELVEIARSFKLEVRINTNGWWGNKGKIQVGNTLFSAPGQVVDWLREHQVALLALSFDNRYNEFPELWQSVLPSSRHVSGSAKLTKSYTPVWRKIEYGNTCMALSGTWGLFLITSFLSQWK